MTLFKIHPAIGIARLGNSEEFYLAPEQPGALPIMCDEQGREARNEDGHPTRVEAFKDSDDTGRVKRQAARFRVFAYDSENDRTGKEIRVGERFEFTLETSTTGRQTVEGTVQDIEWTVHLANKKASWYNFEETAGMHGYKPSHPLRNPAVTQPDERRQLIIDPGPQRVTRQQPHAQFAKGQNPGYPQSFPPDTIQPNPIDTLGELIVNEQDHHLRLIVLGGKGNSGSTNTPVITSFANNDGWFDDISDGPVAARIHYQYIFKFKDAQGQPQEEPRTSSVDVDVPAWCVAGYPRYAPEIEDAVTMDEAMYDLFVRHCAYQPQLFGVAPYDGTDNSPNSESAWRQWRAEAAYNPDYYPKFYEEIWPILRRPDLYQYTFDFDPFEGGDPHNTGTGGNLDENALSAPPTHEGDPNFDHRNFIYDILRKPGQENRFRAEALSRKLPNYRPRAMPLANGNNPLSNTAPEKFFRLTDTQLFLLRQWAAGKFVNECQEWGEARPNCKNPWAEPPTTGVGIDRGVLSNVLGGAFCPGGELGWIMLNLAIYVQPYRLKHATYQAGALSLPKVIADQDGSPAANLAEGLEPGDLTKYIGLPWQADFHACDYQNINITYEDWNNLYLDSTGDPAEQVVAYNIPWWPAHRPIVVQAPSLGQVYWASGIADNNAGSLQMVEAWKDVGFLKYFETPPGTSRPQPGYYQIERNNAALGPPTKPGQRRLGNIKRSDANG